VLLELIQAPHGLGAARPRPTRAGLETSAVATCAATKVDVAEWAIELIQRSAPAAWVTVDFGHTAPRTEMRWSAWANAASYFWLIARRALRLSQMTACWCRARQRKHSDGEKGAGNCAISSWAEA